ncbi:MAG: hypothetical protein ACI9T7_003274 [Oleiphilaceae bacterium]
MRGFSLLKVFKFSQWWRLYLLLMIFFASDKVWAQAENLPETNLSEKNLLEEDMFGGSLLASDEYEFELQDKELTSSWQKNMRITLQQSLIQGKRLEIFRSEARVEYEAAPWEGAYLRFDNKYTYYGYNDQQLGVDSETFGHNKLQEAWLQLSKSSCVTKLGRQGLSWGGVEGAFAVDVVSPFDFTEPLLTDYSNIRLSQDMLTADCYFSNTHIQSFYVLSANINIYQQKDTALLTKLEESLEDEWGVRITQRWEGLDVSFMYAHLYGNDPLSVIDSQQSSGFHLDVSRYDFVGLSAAWAIGRLLLELDLGYKSNELQNFSGKESSDIEVALGFEYTTFNNHQLNAGVWVFDGMIQKPTPQKNLKTGSIQAWNMGWSKTYLNDDLAMSFLGSWLTESDTLSTTLLAQYQWDDYWNFSTALSYTDSAETVEVLSLNASDLTLLIKAKFEF